MEQVYSIQASGQDRSTSEAGVLDRVGRKELTRKRLQALLPAGIQIWFFGYFSISTFKNLIEQMFNNNILLLLAF